MRWLGRHLGRHQRRVQVGFVADAHSVGAVREVWDAGRGCQGALVVGGDVESPPLRG